MVLSFFIHILIKTYRYYVTKLSMIANNVLLWELFGKY